MSNANLDVLSDFYLNKNNNQETLKVEDYEEYRDNGFDTDVHQFILESVKNNKDFPVDEKSIQNYKSKLIKTDDDLLSRLVEFSLNADPLDTQDRVSVNSTNKKHQRILSAGPSLSRKVSIASNNKFEDLDDKNSNMSDLLSVKNLSRTYSQSV